jgi:hypothetical protein
MLFSQNVHGLITGSKWSIVEPNMLGAVGVTFLHQILYQNALIVKKLRISNNWRLGQTTPAGFEKIFVPFMI